MPCSDRAGEEREADWRDFAEADRLRDEILAHGWEPRTPPTATGLVPGE